VRIVTEVDQLLICYYPESWKSYAPRPGKNSENEDFSAFSVCLAARRAGGYILGAAVYLWSVYQNEGGGKGHRAGETVALRCCAWQSGGLEA